MCLIALELMLSRYLSYNNIEGLRDKDLCNMSILEELYLDRNKMTEETIEPEVFSCLGSLKIL